LVTLVFVGLAYGYCVGYSAIDAIKNGQRAIVIDDHTGYVDLKTKGEMVDKLKSAGVVVVKDRDELFAYFETMND